MSWRWPIVACALVAMLMGFLNVGYRLGLAPNEGQLSLGIDYHLLSIRWLLMSYLPKFAAAMVIGLLLVKRSQQKLKLAT